MIRPPVSALLDHLARGALQAEEHALGVDPVDAVPIRLGQIHDVGVAGDAGIVDDDVEPAELRRPSCSTIALMLATSPQSACDRQRPVGVRSPRRSSAPRRCRYRRRRRRALGRHAERDRLADPGPGAGHQHDLVLQARHRPLLLNGLRSSRYGNHRRPSCSIREGTDRARKHSPDADRHRDQIARRTRGAGARHTAGAGAERGRGADPHRQRRDQPRRLPCSAWGAIRCRPAPATSPASNAPAPSSSSAQGVSGFDARRPGLRAARSPTATANTARCRRCNA